MSPSTSRLTVTQWLVCLLAAIGFMFDIYELLMGQFVVRDALRDLGGLQPGTPEFARWASYFILVPMIIGGVFGLLGGWLTDRLGRRRVLTWSILVYALSAFAAGFATSLPMLLVLRTFTILGVCVEFVAAVAWLAEIFVEPRRREKVLGYTQAFSSFGGFLVAVAYGLCARHGQSFPALHAPDWLSWIGTIKDPHAAWRYTLISGVIPALPLIIIRPFLPESPLWLEKKASGSLKRPSLRELFSPRLRRTTVVTTLMFACAYGIAFGAIQQTAQIVPGTPEVRADARARVEEHAAGRPRPEQMKIQKAVEGVWASQAGKIQEVGGLAGRFIFAVLAVYIVSRQRLIRIFQIPALILVPLVFGVFALRSFPLLGVGIFFVGLVVVAQFSFWGNYLPRVFPIHLRGTGESFAANIGGRVIGTSFWGVTHALAITDVPAQAPFRLAEAAAWVGGLLCLAGLVLSFFLPEPRDDPDEVERAAG